MLVLCFISSKPRNMTVLSWFQKSSLGSRTTTDFYPRRHRDIAFIRAPRPERSVRPVRTRRACFPGACGPGGSSARWLGAEVARRRLTGPVAEEAPDLDLRRTARSTSRSRPSLHRALRRMAGLVFLLVFWVLAGACQRHGVGGVLLCNTTTTTTPRSRHQAKPGVPSCV